jgi:hypothetical protein
MSICVEQPFTTHDVAFQMGDPLPKLSSPSGVVLFREQSLDFSSNRHCFRITALNNSVINPPVTIQLDIHTEIFRRDGGIASDHVKTEPGVLSIRDNDGKYCTRVDGKTNLIGGGGLMTKSELSPVIMQWNIDRAVLVVLPKAQAARYVIIKDHSSSQYGSMSCNYKT